MARSVEERVPVTILDPESPASRALDVVANWGPIDHARTARAFYERARHALR